MPIILYGTRHRNSILSGGEFTCPNCHTLKGYSLTRRQSWFTLFFLPIFPVGSSFEYVECRACGKHYDQEILKFHPPAEATRSGSFVQGAADTDKNLVFARESLLRGVSLNMTQFRLQERGLRPEQAEAVVRSLCHGEPRRCTCGRRYHPDIAWCEDCEADLPQPHA
jgi:hypothetical protein